MIHRRDRRQLPFRSSRPRPIQGWQAYTLDEPPGTVGTLLDTPCTVAPATAAQLAQVRLYYLSGTAIASVNPTAVSQGPNIEGSGTIVLWHYSAPFNPATWLGLELPIDFPPLVVPTGGLPAANSAGLPAQGLMWMPLVSPLGPAVGPLNIISATVIDPNTLELFFDSSPMVAPGFLPSWVIDGAGGLTGWIVPPFGPNTLQATTSDLIAPGSVIEVGPAPGIIQGPEGQQIPTASITLS